MERSSPWRAIRGEPQSGQRAARSAISARQSRQKLAIGTTARWAGRFAPILPALSRGRPAPGDLHGANPRTDCVIFCRCLENMTRAGRVAHISCAFAGRNSLLAGNLAGNLQNCAGFASFQAAGAADRVTYQDVRQNSLFLSKTRNCRGITGKFWQTRNSLCLDMGASRCLVRDPSVLISPPSPPESGCGRKHLAILVRDPSVAGMISCTIGLLRHIVNDNSYSRQPKTAPGGSPAGRGEGASASPLPEGEVGRAKRAG
jgi:hypothetical protein